MEDYSAAPVCKALLPIRDGRINHTLPMGSLYVVACDCEESDEAFDPALGANTPLCEYTSNLPALEEIYLSRVGFGSMCCSMTRHDFYPAITEALAQRERLRLVEIERCNCGEMSEVVKRWEKLVGDVAWDGLRFREDDSDEE